MNTYSEIINQHKPQKLKKKKKVWSSWNYRTNLFGISIKVKKKTGIPKKSEFQMSGKQIKPNK